MSWSFYILLSVVTASFIAILQKVLMKDEHSDPLLNTIALQFIGALVCFAIAFARGFITPPFLKYPLNFLIEAILYGFSTVFSFKALKYIEASKLAVIFSFGALVSILFSAIFLKEVLTLPVVLGALLIIVAIAIVSGKDAFSLKNKGMSYALISCFLGGLALVNDGYLLRFSEAVSYTAVAFLLPGILLLLLYPKSTMRFNKILRPGILGKMILLSAVWGVSAIAFYLAIEKGVLVSQISPISQTRIILTVLLSAVLLKERQNLLAKIMAGVLAVAGIMLIT